MGITWNPADFDPGFDFTNEDLTVTRSASGYRGGRATGAKSAGRWYWEIKADLAALSSGVNMGIGIANADKNLAAEDKGDANSYTYRGWNGNKSQSSEVGYGDTYTTGDIIGVALDLDAGKIWWSKNGVWQNSGDPAAGTGEAFSGITGNWYPYFNSYVENNQCTANFGETALTFTPPAGFDPLTGELVTIDFSPRLIKTIAILAPNPVSVKPLVPTIAKTISGRKRFTGIGTISDIITINGTPGRRRVAIFDHITQLKVAETWSDPATGAYTFSGLDCSRTYMVVCDDYTQTYNAAVADWVAPEVPE